MKVTEECNNTTEVDLAERSDETNDQSLMHYYHVITIPHQLIRNKFEMIEDRSSWYYPVISHHGP